MNLKKIITAIDSPEINEKLKKEYKLEIVGKDIQYREAILDVLKKRKDVNTIILYEKILGKITIEELITEIQKINSNINIIFFLEKNNKEKILKLQENNIKNIYTKKEIKIEYLINILNNQKIENKKSRFKNKIIILTKEKIKKYRNNKKFKKYLNFKKRNIKKYEKNKILITGKNDLDKNIIIINIINYLRKINKRILLINIDKKNKVLFSKLNITNNYYKDKKNKSINCEELYNIIKIKSYLNKIENKIDKNLICISNINNILKKINNKKIIDNFLNILFENKANKFDYIIINDGFFYNKKIRDKLLYKVNKVILILEKNCGTKDEVNKCLIEINKYLKNRKDTLNIILKSENIKNIDFNILKQIYKNKIKIKLYNFNYLFKNYKNKKYLINKEIKNILK